MGCIHTSNSNKSRITICVMELKCYIDIFNQSVICRVRGLETIRHLPSSRVRGDLSSAVIEVERVKTWPTLILPCVFTNVCVDMDKLSFIHSLINFSVMMSYLVCLKRKH